MPVSRQMTGVERPACKTRSLPFAAATDEPQNDQQQNGTDGGGDYRADDAGAEVNTHRRKQPAADQGADDAKTEVGNEAVAGAAHEVAGQPSGNQADDKYNEKTFS